MCSCSPACSVVSQLCSCSPACSVVAQHVQVQLVYKFSCCCSFLSFTGGVAVGRKAGHLDPYPPVSGRAGPSGSQRKQPHWLPAHALTHSPHAPRPFTRGSLHCLCVWRGLCSVHVFISQLWRCSIRNVWRAAHVLQVNVCFLHVNVQLTVLHMSARAAG